MSERKSYNDLREFIRVLEANDKLYRITRAINKDTELQPLVRWQFRGLNEDQRKAFLFENVTDSKGRKYRGSVLVGGLAGTGDIYCLGLQCKAEEVADRWLYAMDHPIEPEIVSNRAGHGRNSQGRGDPRSRRFPRVSDSHFDAGLR